MASPIALDWFNIEFSSRCNLRCKWCSLDFDKPVERAIVEECLEIALQAPTGSNSQGWHWIIVEDAAKKMALADIYADLKRDHDKQRKMLKDLAELTDTAKRGKFDLVVMGSHGHGLFRNLVLGSVATRVLAACTVPVLIIR